MFIFDDNGLLASKKQQQTQQDKTAQNLSRFKGVVKLDREKELSNLEEQTDLLKKIYRSGRGFTKSKSTTSSLAKDLTKKATIGAVAGAVAGVIKKLLKKGGILAPFLTNTDKAKKQYAKEQGLFVEDLGLKDRLKSLVVTLGDSVVDVVNNALSALGIDYQLPKGKVKELIDTIDNKMGEIFQNFVDNTGTFGKELQSFLNSTDSFLGKTLENAKTQFRMLTDVFMKQSKDWKEFIKVVKEADELEGMKGYVADKDKAKYEKLRKRATELAKKLQNNKDFVEHSGYQVIAKNLLNPAKRAKIDNQMAKNKVADKNSIITQGIGILTGKPVTIDDKLKAKKEEEQTYIKYIQEKRKHYNITDAEQKRYNQIVANRNRDINEQIKKLDKSKEIALLDKAIKINSDMMIKDAQHKEVYQKNIEEADKRRKELLKQQDENTKKIAELQKQLMKPIADTKAVGSNAYDESSSNNKVGSDDNLFLKQLAKVESSNNWKIGKNAGGYEGKYQFRFGKGDDGTKYLKEIGKTYSQWKNSEAVQDELMRKAMEHYKKELKSAGLPVNNYTLWLRHNQGLEGAKQILKGNISSTVKKNMLNQFGTNEKKKLGLNENSDSSKIIEAYNNKFKPKFAQSESNSNDYSNITYEDLNIKKKLIDKQNRSKYRVRKDSEIKKILWHRTGGKNLYLGRAEKTGIGAQLWIDKDGTIIQTVDNINRISSQAGRTDGRATNANSIGVEVVGTTGKDGKYHAPTKAQQESIRKLTAYFKKRYNLTEDDMLYHGEVATKKNGQYGRKNLTEGLNVAKIAKETIVASKISKQPTTKVAQQQNTTTSNNKQTVVVKTDNSDIINAINNQTKALTKNNKPIVTPSNQTTIAYTPSRQALSNG